MRKDNKIIFPLMLVCVVIVLFAIFKNNTKQDDKNITIIKDSLKNHSDIKISFVGDIMLGRTVGERIDTYGINSPFEYVKEHLSQSDISFGNLETTISNLKGISWKSCCEFKADEKVVEGLSWSGFDVLSLANNHVLDYGGEVYLDTLNNLKEYNISFVGINFNEGYFNSEDLKIFNIKNEKIGFLAYYDDDKWYIHDSKWNPQPLVYNEKYFLEDIEGAKKQVNILIVSMHWGKEYEKHANSKQKRIAHLAIDHGVDIVIGHHPHVVQEIEEYNGGIIAYSLGNFVFDQPTSETPYPEGTNKSIILDVYINENNILSYNINKIDIFNKYQPRFTEDEK